MADRTSPDSMSESERAAIISTRPAALSAAFSEATWLRMGHATRQDILQNMGLNVQHGAKEADELLAQAQREELDRLENSARDSALSLAQAERLALDLAAEEHAFKQKKQNLDAELKRRTRQAERDAQDKERFLAKQERTRRLASRSDAPQSTVAGDSADSAFDAASTASPLRAESSHDQAGPSSPAPPPVHAAALSPAPAAAAAAAPPVSGGAKDYFIPKRKKPSLRLATGTSSEHGAGASAIAIRDDDKHFCTVPLAQIANSQCADLVHHYRDNVRRYAQALLGAAHRDCKNQATLKDFVALVNLPGGGAAAKVVVDTTALLGELRRAFANLPREVSASSVSWSQEPVFFLRLQDDKGGSSSGHDSSAPSSFRLGAAAANRGRRGPDRSDYGAQSASRRGVSSDRSRGRGRGGARRNNSRGDSTRRGAAKHEREGRHTRRREEKKPSERNTRPRKEERAPNRTRRREDSPRRSASRTRSPVRKEASPSPLRGRGRVRESRREERRKEGQPSDSEEEEEKSSASDGGSASPSGEGEASPASEHGEAEAG